MIGPDTQITVKPWVKRYPGSESATATLIFPHAGGAALAYRGFGMALAAAGSDAYVMQYPQRGDRLSHPAAPTVGDLAKDLFDAADWAGVGSIRLFGHCMGAVVAFEFARIAERNGVAIDALWVSASEAPSAVAAAPALPMAESEILAEMVDLGGTDEALLADEDFVELLLMAVRADYAAFNRYSCEAEVTITADIYALGGESDHRINEDMLRRWDSHTTGAYTCSMFDGGHFYLNSQLEDVAELVNEL
ncbi:thioesterase II family protein [Mycolicibacterium lutetiense]